MRFLFVSTIFILIILSGCNYKATLGEPKVVENTSDYSKVDGYRLKSGEFRIVSNNSSILTGEAKIVKTKNEEYYLFLSDNFKIEDSDSYVLYLSSNPSVTKPSDLTDKYSLGELKSSNKFQYYEMRNEFGIWLQGELYQSVAIYNSKSGMIIGYAHLYKTEPFEENLWIQSHSTVY